MSMPSNLAWPKCSADSATTHESTTTPHTRTHEKPNIISQRVSSSYKKSKKSPSTWWEDLCCHTIPAMSHVDTMYIPSLCKYEGNKTCFAVSSDFRLFCHLSLSLTSKKTNSRSEYQFVVCAVCCICSGYHHRIANEIHTVCVCRQL